MAQQGRQAAVHTRVYVSDGVPRAPAGMMAVKAAAKAAGAYGCTISGAGPTAVAVVDNRATGEKVGGQGGACACPESMPWLHER